MNKIEEIKDEMKREHEYKMDRLNEKLEIIGDKLDEFKIEDYYSGDIRITVDSMTAVNEIFKVLLAAGLKKPSPRSPEFGKSIAQFNWFGDGIYIAATFPIDDIPEVLQGDCEIKQVKVKEVVIAAHMKTVMVCNKEAS